MVWSYKTSVVFFEKSVFVFISLPSFPNAYSEAISLICLRYWTHVVQCSSCSLALRLLRALEASLPILSLILIGVVAASKQSAMSAITRTGVASIAVLCFAASSWLSHFIYKTFYFHDYNHAFIWCRWVSYFFFTFIL